jgi:protease I
MSKKVNKALVLTANKFEDLEVFVPTFRLMGEGWQVDIAAPKKVQLTGENGYQLGPDKTFSEVNPDDYDLLIIPGGGGGKTDAPWVVSRDKDAQRITKSFFEKNKPVASICHGPYTLASSGVVKGRHLTSYWHDNVPEEVKAAGGLWVDKEVVVDKNLVTSRWPMDLPFFCREMMDLVNK